LSYGKYLNRRLSTEEQAEIGNEVKQAMSYACPFLGVTGCSIYQARPIICRAYGITLMADEWCPRKLHFTESATKRMFVSPDTPLGRDIRMRLSRLYKFLGSLNGAGAYASTSFLTTHIAEILAPNEIKKLADDGLVPDAFQAHSLVQANIFAMRPGAIVQ
jgi:Fe-S-cluster containining protein